LEQAMTVIIDFPGGAHWQKANWVYRRFSEDVVACSQADAEIADAMQQGLYFNHLPLDTIPEPLRTRIAKVMRDVARRTLAGEIPGWKRTHPDDENGIRGYTESLIEFLETLNSAHVITD
jgi:hypothetical protein